MSQAEGKQTGVGSKEYKKKGTAYLCYRHYNS